MAEIPEAGWYDLEYYISDLSGVGVPQVNTMFIGELDFTVRHAGTDNEVSFTVTEDTGWQYLSSFELDVGPVEVLLSNESNGAMIYADAIRWVKK